LRSKETIIGIVVIIGLGLLYYGIQFLMGYNPFGDPTKVYARYDNVGGLVKSNPVLLNGFKIGQVDQIKIDPKDPSKFVVTLLIDEKDAKIPIDSKAKITSDLLGSRAISIELGQKTDKLVSTGDFLEGDIDPDLKKAIDEQIRPLVEKTEGLIGKIEDVVVTIDHIFDSTAATNLETSFESIRKSILTFERTSRRIDSLIATEKQRMSNIFSNIESISVTLRNSNDKVSNIINNLSNVSDSLATIELASTITEAQNAIASLSVILDNVNNGDGSLSKLIRSDTLINNMNEMLVQTQTLVKDLYTHPERYLHFSVFGRKIKGQPLNASEQQTLDSLLTIYPELKKLIPH
jgi:phospholipid/cholesterol/gamma-HCH transport system substrate-binding protein